MQVTHRISLNYKSVLSKLIHFNPISFSSISYFTAKNLFSTSQTSFVETPETLVIDPYLAQRLKVRGLSNLKDFQIETYKKVINQNKNCFINSCTGSGKTLAYLLPVVDRLLKQKQEWKKNNSTESQGKYDHQLRHGAVILTLNKELSLQVYRGIRLLDVQNKLNCYRVGPLSHFSPAIDLLVSVSYNQNKKQKTSDDFQQIEDLMGQNLVRCVDWRCTDILIGTPQMLFNVLSSLSNNKQSSIIPQFVVVDQADLLLEIDQNLSRYTKKMLGITKNTIKKQSQPILQVQKGSQKGTRFLLCSSSFPLKVDKKPFKQFMESHFSPIQIVTGVNKHRLPERVQLKYIEVQTVRKENSHSDSDQEVDNEKLFYLSQIMSDPDKKGNRFIVFCNSKAAVQKVSQFLEAQLKKRCLQYYAALPSDQRSLNLYKFANEDFEVLVSTDLGSRGLDFERAVHTVIEFEMAENIVNFINRAGRTGRNNLAGEVISFVEKKNRIFFQYLSQFNSNDEEFSGLFSRKRSFNKLILKNLKQ